MSQGMQAAWSRKNRFSSGASRRTVPLYNIPVCVNVPENIKRIYLAPQMEEISFKKADGMICCLVPEIECHQMVVMEY